MKDMVKNKNLARQNIEIPVYQIRNNVTPGFSVYNNGHFDFYHRIERVYVFGPFMV